MKVYLVSAWPALGQQELASRFWSSPDIVHWHICTTLIIDFNIEYLAAKYSRQIDRPGRYENYITEICTLMENMKKHGPRDGEAIVLVEGRNIVCQELLRLKYNVIAARPKWQCRPIYLDKLHREKSDVNASIPWIETTEDFQAAYRELSDIGRRISGVRGCGKLEIINIDVRAGKSLFTESYRILWSRNANIF